MADIPLPIAIAALVKDGRILLIKRVRGDYIGLLGLPGGKIEKSEHVSQAAVREVFEESGIESKFKKHLGFVSEHIVENGNVIQHLMLHVCELEPQTDDIFKGSEGNVEWFPIDELAGMKERIIPSDFLIIENMVLGDKTGYFECVLEKQGENYILRRFE